MAEYTRKMEGRIPWNSRTWRLIIRNLRLHFIFASVPLTWNEEEQTVTTLSPSSSPLRVAAFYFYFLYNIFNTFWVGGTFIHGISCPEPTRSIKSLVIDLFLLAAMLIWLAVNYNCSVHGKEYANAVNSLLCFNPREIFCSYRHKRFRDLTQNLDCNTARKDRRPAPIRHLFITIWQKIAAAVYQRAGSLQRRTEQGDVESKYNMAVELFSTFSFFNGFVITFCFGLMCALDPTNDRYIWGFLWRSSGTVPMQARIVGFTCQCFFIWHAWSCIIFHAETVLIMVCGMLEHLQDIRSGKYSLNDALKIYRGLAILTGQINESCSTGILFGHTIGMSLIQISGIYVTVKLMSEVGFPTAMVFPCCVATATFVCTFLYGWMAELSQLSQASLRKLTVDCQPLYKRERAIRALRPLKLKSGSFYTFSETTAFTYMNFVLDKTVLLLII